MVNKTPVHINQTLKLVVDRIGKDGDAIFIHNGFIIFLKDTNIKNIPLNEFLNIRITKILPTFALAVLVK